MGLVVDVIGRVSLLAFDDDLSLLYDPDPVPNCY